MAKQPDTPKTYFICQLYEEKKAGRSGTHLAVKNAVPCSDANQAQSRAERSFNAGTCVGADAFTVTVDPDTEETSNPVFLVRLGRVPEIEPV